MNKRIKNLLVALALVLTTNSSVFAQPSSKDNNNSASKVQSMEANIEKLDNQIEDVMSKIDNNNKQIVKTQKDIKGAENDLKNAQNDIKKEQDLFGKRMRAMYISGSNGYLSIILDSNGLEDFISKIDIG